MIILFGVKHSGKSTIGKLLAQKLNVDFFDIDELIVATSGKPVRVLFNLDGIKTFQEYEANALIDVIKKNKNCVIATGGGICDNSKVIDFLTQKTLEIHSFFLDIPEEVAYQRIIDEGKITGSLPSFINNFSTIYVERTKKYRQFCSYVINTQNKTPDQISYEILTKL